MRILARLTLVFLLIALAMPWSAPSVARMAEVDFDLPGGQGHFYGQADGQGGASGLGFVVDNSDGIPFWDYLKAVGGPTVVGYPISDRMLWNGFTVQAFQKVVFQWRPEARTVYYVNIFDEMHDRGMDAFLEAARSVPPPADTQPDTGLPWDKVVERHYAFLDSDPDIKQAFLNVPDPINLNGLPMAPIKQIGEVLVLRAQRVVFQKWLTDTSFAKKGQVVVANGGDVAKELGLFPKESVTPKAPTAQRIVYAVDAASGPPGSSTSPTPTPTPSGPIYPYLQRGETTWEPNCGITLIKGRIYNGSGAPAPGVTVKVWTAGWPGTISNPANVAGEWDVLLDNRPKAGRWSVAVVKKETGELQSPVVEVETDTANCNPGGNGRQVARVDFQENTDRRPGPSTGASPTPTNTPVPTGTPSGNVAGIRIVDPPTGQYQPAYIEVHPNAKWAVQLLHQLTPCENRSLGLIFVETYDLNGQPVNVPLKNTAGLSFRTGEKGPGKVEIWNYGGNQTIFVDDGSPSDKAANMDTAIWIPPPDVYCEGKDSLGGNVYKHISYKVVFKQIR